MKTEEKKNQKGDGTGKEEYIGYKLSPKLKKDLYAYLNTRPMAEVESIMLSMFETEDPDPFYSLEGIRMLVDYLQKSCPRVDVKDFVKRMGEEVSKYSITPANDSKTDEKKDGGQNT